MGIPGIFQDGGLHHNNPSDISLWEAKFLWPSKIVPDVALSLGTGTSSKKLQKLSRAPWRLWNSFMRTIDTEESYKRFKNSLPAALRSRFHRLNLQFQGNEPRLDDVTSIPSLKLQMPESLCSDYNNICAVTDALVASMFYFELDDPPKYQRGQFHASGFVSCRLNLSAKGRSNLQNRLADSDSWFLVQGRPVPCVTVILSSNPPFRCRLTYSVDTLDDAVAISIRGITKTTRYISGFPTTTQALLNLQQLQSPFGREDHSIPEKPLPAIPRKRSSVSERETKKKRRKEVG